MTLKNWKTFFWKPFSSVLHFFWNVKYYHYLHCKNAAVNFSSFYFSYSVASCTSEIIDAQRIKIEAESRSPKIEASAHSSGCLKFLSANFAADFLITSYGNSSYNFFSQPYWDIIYINKMDLFSVFAEFWQKSTPM